MKIKPQKPVSLRIDAATRVLLDYLIERTGLKEAQIIRLAIKFLADEEARRPIAGAPKPARKTR